MSDLENHVGLTAEALPQSVPQPLPLGKIVIRRAAETAVRRDGGFVLRRMSNRKAKRKLDLRLDINLYSGQPHLCGYRPTGAA